jgi:hypothetical protein
MLAQCFLSIPALIYQVMVPMWSRAWRFANVYAYAAIDVAYTILWLAAFAAVANWNASGTANKSSDNTDSKDTDSGSCAHGNASKCAVSKASVGFGVLICLLFAATSFLSIRSVFEYRRTGVMPNSGNRIHGKAPQGSLEDPNKDVWNANPEELGPDRQSNENPFNDERHAYGQISQQDVSEQGAGLLRNNQTGYRNTSHDESGSDDDPHPGRQLSYGSDNLSIAPPAYDGGHATSALSPGGYEQTPGGRVSFPTGNYGDAFR